MLKNREKNYYQKKGTLKTEVSNFTVLVLNQSSISAVPLIVRCPRDQKTALMGDPLYYDDTRMLNKLASLTVCIRASKLSRPNSSGNLDESCDHSTLLLLSF